MTKNELATRWLTVENRETKKLLSSGSDPFDLTTAGYRDFRGIPIQGALNCMTLIRVDFSNATSSVGQLGGGSKFEQCIFDGLQYEGSLCSDFSECSFVSSRLCGSTIVGSFGNCRFDASNLQKTRCSQTQFENCEFAKVDFRKASFYNCHFKACSFVSCRFGGGSLGGSCFTDCEWNSTDLGNTILEGVKGLVGPSAEATPPV